jgi:hypothetical protein
MCFSIKTVNSFLNLMAKLRKIFVSLQTQSEIFHETDEKEIFAGVCCCDAGAGIGAAIVACQYDSSRACGAGTDGTGAVGTETEGTTGAFTAGTDGVMGPPAPAAPTLALTLTLTLTEGTAGGTEATG